MTGVTTTCRLNSPVKTCSATTDVQDLLLSYSNASKLSRGGILSLSLADSRASLENASRRAALIAFLTLN